MERWGGGRVAVTVQNDVDKEENGDDSSNRKGVEFRESGEYSRRRADPFRISSWILPGPPPPPPVLDRYTENFLQNSQADAVKIKLFTADAIEKNILLYR